MVGGFRGRRRPVALCVLLVAVAGSNAASAADDPPLRIRAPGLLIKVPGEHLQLCTGGVNDSLPPQCEGMRVRGLDLDELSGVREAGGVRWVEHVQIVGRYHDRVLTATGIRRLRLQTRPRVQFPIPQCQQPPGTPETSSDVAAVSIASRIEPYVASRYPDTYAGLWTASNGVLAIAFTDAPGTYEAELRYLAPGAPLCVVDATNSQTLQRQVQARIGADELELIEAGIIIQGTGSLGVLSDWKVVVNVEVPDPRDVSELYRRYGKAHVTVRSSVEILDSGRSESR